MPEAVRGAVMPKEFNVTGLCIPEKNYMVDISGRIDIIVQNYISKGKYFTINRARQYGKTTTLYLLEQRLKDQYMVIRLSFEAADEMFASLYALTVGLVRKIGRILKMQGANASLVEEWELPVSKLFPLDDLGEKITALCRCSGKEIVLIIDEVDKSSDNQIFLSFLGLLRNKYLEQQQGNDCTFTSVILAGVYDIKNLKLKLRSDQEIKYNSPWNIAADFTVNMSFMPEEIAGMLQAYEQDAHTGMDIETMSRLIYAYTSGYPYLVSWLCKTMDEQIPKKDGFGTKAAAWTKEGLTEAVKELLAKPGILFDDMTKKLNDFPELKKMLYIILFKGGKIPYNPDIYEIQVGFMFGFLKDDKRTVAVSNRIFETRMYDLFLSEEVLESRIYKAAVLDKNQFIHDGRLNMEHVLRKFTEAFNDIYADADQKFIEENGRRFFLLYLKPIINGTGNYYIEARTRDRRRTDVIVDYHGEQYVCELKTWHGNEYNRRAEKQLIGYLDDYHLSTGYLVSFNFNKNKQVGVKRLHIDGRTIIEAVV